MTEHKICKDCKWNKYPLCEGTKMYGEFMNIENLNESFICGRKDKAVMVDFIESKTKLELLEERIEVLEFAKKEA